MSTIARRRACCDWRDCCGAATNRQSHSPHPQREMSECVVPGSQRQNRSRDHRKRDSIEAHPSIVFAALAVSHWTEPVEARPGRDGSRSPTLVALR
jgi:hypothetical protein